MDGAKGDNGDQGSAGVKGDPGEAGKSCAVTMLPSGDATCPYGGTVITDPTGSTSTLCKAPAIRYVGIEPGREFFSPLDHLYAGVNDFMPMWNATTTVTIGARGAKIHGIGRVIVKSQSASTTTKCTFAFAINGQPVLAGLGNLGHGTAIVGSEYATVPVEYYWSMSPGTYSIGLRVWPIAGGCLVADGLASALLIIEDL